MRKIAAVGLALLLCLGIPACGKAEKETALSEIEGGCAQLLEMESLTYEYSIKINDDSETGEIRYLVWKDNLTGAWAYSMYADDILVLEYRQEADGLYRNVEGTWTAVEEAAEPPFICDTTGTCDIVPETDQVAEAAVSREQDGVIIKLQMNNEALRQREAEMALAGEAAIAALEELDAGAEAVEAQRAQNDKTDKISFTGDTRYYTLDEGGMLITYRQILEYRVEGGAEDEVLQAEICFNANL